MFWKRAFHGGVHPPEHKYTRDEPIKDFRDVETVAIPMHMHAGVPCKAIVKRREEVKRGQVIGEPMGIAAPIHASVSGTVKSVREQFLATGRIDQVITIESDGKFELHEDCLTLPTYHDRESFLEAVRASGLVGLGGAGFPTWQKFNQTNPERPVETLLINGMECEPFITSDYRQMLEYPHYLVEGAIRLIDALGLKRVLIGIEDNKPEAYEAVSQVVSEKGKEAEKIEVKMFKTRFPQGAAKMFVYAALGEPVPAGAHTTDIGAQVINVSTVGQLEKYFQTGEPLVDKVVTISGDAIEHPGNYRVPIGTNIKELIEKTAGFKEEPAKVLMGGPMNGVVLSDIDESIIKNNNAITCLTEEAAALKPESACIRCGRCVDACPMQLMPLVLDRAGRSKRFNTLDEYAVMNCIECGSCSYVCPANRQLVQGIRTGKAFYRIESKKRQIAQKAGE